MPPTEPLIHFDAAKVIINPEIMESVNAGVTLPFQLVRLITCNGEIWDKAFLPFGLSIAAVIADWNLRDLKTWGKVEQ